MYDVSWVLRSRYVFFASNETFGFITCFPLAHRRYASHCGTYSTSAVCGLAGDEGSCVVESLQKVVRFLPFSSFFFRLQLLYTRAVFGCSRAYTILAQSVTSENFLSPLFELVVRVIRF